MCQAANFLFTSMCVFKQELYNVASFVLQPCLVKWNVNTKKCDIWDHFSKHLLATVHRLRGLPNILVSLNNTNTEIVSCITLYVALDLYTCTSVYLNIHGHTYAQACAGVYTMQHTHENLTHKHAHWCAQMHAYRDAHLYICMHTLFCCVNMYICFNTSFVCPPKLQPNNTITVMQTMY